MMNFKIIKWFIFEFSKPSIENVGMESDQSVQRASEAKESGDREVREDDAAAVPGGLQELPARFQVAADHGGRRTEGGRGEEERRAARRTAGQCERAGGRPEAVSRKQAAGEGSV